MLGRYLPEDDGRRARAWSPDRHVQAQQFVRRLVQIHDADLPVHRPHADMIALATSMLSDPDLQRSLRRGWTLAPTAAADV